jgi:hypothetical protein
MDPRRLVVLAETLLAAGPARSVTPTRLMERLASLGLRPRVGRNTALMDFDTKLPAAVLSYVAFGLHITTAAGWSRNAGSTRLGSTAEVPVAAHPTAGCLSVLAWRAACAGGDGAGTRRDRAPGRDGEQYWRVAAGGAV